MFAVSTVFLVAGLCANLPESFNKGFYSYYTLIKESMTDSCPVNRLDSDLKFHQL